MNRFSDLQQKAKPLESNRIPFRTERQMTTLETPPKFSAQKKPLKTNVSKKMVKTTDKVEKKNNRSFEEKIVFGTDSEETALKWIYLIRWLLNQNKAKTNHIMLNF